ncbi:lysosomal acid phosphatase-like [Scaptodrosophila lebanonensis]|uniref:Lysosomal acid phosphatase-like n=1 Tax=Drosophila lebanonensis TaxID=7225 RepID=A0A6J2T4C5_DROLE|nr:lysosomal acid phosphatase-like [Scaptodrosophila lebanonensis]
MPPVDCKSHRGTKISVILLGSALCFVMMAYFVFGDSNDEQGLRNLRMISILFRHGARNPTEFYPNDPHVAHDWQAGPGALTRVHCRPTIWERICACATIGYCPPIASTHNSRFMCSARPRSGVMSAQSVLAGFMPPLENNNVLPIPWQPVAINTLARSDDILLAQKKPCLKYDTILQKLYKNPPKDLQRLNEENKELYKLLTKNTGKNISTVLDVEMLYNTLKTEEEANLVLPDWTENICPESMKPLAERSYTLHRNESHEADQRWCVSHRRSQENAEQRRKNLNPDRKIFLYAGHDVTMVNVMNSLNILDQTANLPDYAAALAFELHHSKSFSDDDFEVKLVYYYNSEDKFPKELIIPNCDAPCSLTQFAKSLNALLLDNYDETCENPTPDCKA